MHPVDSSLPQNGTRPSAIHIATSGILASMSDASDDSGRLRLGSSNLDSAQFVLHLKMPHLAYAFARPQAQRKALLHRRGREQRNVMKEAKRQRQNRLQQCLESVQEWRYDPTCDGVSLKSGGAGAVAICPSGRCVSSRGPIIRYITTLLHINTCHTLYSTWQKAKEAVALVNPRTVERRLLSYFVTKQSRSGEQYTFETPFIFFRRRYTNKTGSRCHNFTQISPLF